MTIISFKPEDEAELAETLKGHKVTLTGVEVTYKIKENLPKEILEILFAKKVITKYLSPE